MEYQPLHTEQSSSAVPQFSHPNELSQRRCKSAFYPTGNASPMGSKMQTEPECISLPGQINLDLDTANVDGVKRGAEFLVNVNVSNSAALIPSGESGLHEEDITGETSDIKEQHDLIDNSRAKQTPLRELMYKEIEQSNDIIEESSQVNDEQEIQPVRDVMQVGNSQHSITSAVSTDITKLNDTQSYLSHTSAQSSVHSSSGNVTKYYQQMSESSHESNTPHVRTKPLTLVLYALCAVMVYPFLLALVPLLLIFKLVSFLCCCIPCYRHKRRKTQTAFNQQLPLFFTSHPGGYHTIGIELQEQMDGATFVEYMISKLNNTYSHGSSAKQSIVYRLASVIQQIACFSWWERAEGIVNLEEHIQIVQKRITTKTNFTDFIEQASKNRETVRQRRKLWRVYFFPCFKTSGSSVLLQVHNSLLSGVDLKDILLTNFSDGSNSLEFKDNSVHPTIAETALLAPGVVLKHLLRSLLKFRQLSKRYRFVYSSPMHLSEATQMANHSGISLHALFMAPLSQCLRDLFFQKYSSRSVCVAIPVNSQSCGHSSIFFVNLPLLASQAWDATKLQSLNGEIYRNSKDSSILLSATKFASFAFSRCTVDSLVSLTLRQADILFNIVRCPSDPHYLENYAISSIMYWPPLFDQISIGVCVMVYEQSFRVCIVTDSSVIDWSDILLKLYIASYSELYKTVSTMH